MNLLFTRSYYDQLYETLKYLNYTGIVQICQLDYNISNYCKTNFNVQQLINSKKSIRSRSIDYIKRWENNAFNIACEAGDIEVVEDLLQTGADPTTKNNYALINASTRGHVDIVNRLLQDSRVNFYIDTKNRALISAIINKRLNVVNRLLQDPQVDPRYDGNSALHQAIIGNRTEIIFRLIQDDRVDPSAYENQLIRWASAWGHLNLVVTLLSDSRVNPGDSYQGANYAIVRASRNGHYDIVRLLLTDERVDPTVNNNDAIKSASLKGHLDIVEYLLRDKRVWKSLTSQDGKKYLKQIKN